MSVLLETSLGEIVIDLHCDQCPITCKNFLKLCKIKYYNHCIFHDVKKDFIAQTGDPSGTGSGGDSVYKFLYGDQARFFKDEVHPKLTHDKIGTVAMASAGEDLNASQFYITLRAGLDYLDGKHTVFGEVAEGLETLARISEAYVDEKGRPFKNIRIKHVSILDDPFDDPPPLVDLIPDRSPDPKPPAEGEEVRLEDDWVPMDELMDPEEVDKSLRSKEAHSRAVVLEMIGDIPDAEIAPPENVLFICKLNPVTQEDDLNTLFSRFGKIISADIIRDYKTGDSLCYGFIEFETNEACEAAYFKMDNVLIDDRRVHVDFSQSVAKLWTRYRRFGARDTNEHGPDAPSQRGKGGCFNCGEFGHLKLDCPHGPDGAKGGASTTRPSYTLKDSAGQRGDPKSRYEMVFDHNGHGNEHEKPDHQRKFRSNTAPSKRRSSTDERNDRSTRPRLSSRDAPDREDRASRHWSRSDREDSSEDDKTREHNDRGRPGLSFEGKGEEKGHKSRREERHQEDGRRDGRGDSSGRRERYRDEDHYRREVRGDPVSRRERLHDDEENRREKRVDQLKRGERYHDDEENRREKRGDQLKRGERHYDDEENRREKRVDQLKRGERYPDDEETRREKRGDQLERGERHHDDEENRREKRVDQLKRGERYQDDEENRREKRGDQLKRGERYHDDEENRREKRGDQVKRGERSHDDEEDMREKRGDQLKRGELYRDKEERIESSKRDQHHHGYGGRSGEASSDAVRRNERYRDRGDSRREARDRREYHQRDKEDSSKKDRAYEKPRRRGRGDEDDGSYSQRNEKGDVEEMKSKVGQRESRLSHEDGEAGRR